MRSPVTKMGSPAVDESGPEHEHEYEKRRDRTDDVLNRLVQRPTVQGGDAKGFGVATLGLLSGNRVEYGLSAS